MKDQRNPYAEPTVHSAVESRARFWPSQFLAASCAALISIVLLYLLWERKYFADQTNDPALLVSALPYLIGVSLAAGLASSFSVKINRFRAALIGLLLGPAFALVAYMLYPLARRAATA